MTITILPLALKFPKYTILTFIIPLNYNKLLGYNLGCYTLPPIKFHQAFTQTRIFLSFIAFEHTSYVKHHLSRAPRLPHCFVRLPLTRLSFNLILIPLVGKTHRPIPIHISISIHRHTSYVKHHLSRAHLSPHHFVRLPLTRLSFNLVLVPLVGKPIDLSLSTLVPLSTGMGHIGKPYEPISIQIGISFLILKRCGTLWDLGCIPNSPPLQQSSNEPPLKLGFSYLSLHLGTRLT